MDVAVPEGGKADSLKGEERTMRMLEGNAEVVGVAGRILTEV